MKSIIYSSIAIIKRLSFLFFVSFIFCGVTNAQPYTAFTQVSDVPAGGTTGMPANRYDGPGGTNVETGVKFRVSQSGNINGVWFYKGNLNTGTHTAHLWNVTGGGPLTTATLAGGSDGWLYIAFGSAYHVTTGVTYVASVYMPTGTYASTAGYFSGPLTNGGITLLCDCDMFSANNGVFDYTTTGPLTSPPTNTFGGANYWIDVSFTPDFSLPVSLTDFKATTTNNNVLVSWKTDHESNNKGFEIQRSNNGSDWYAINFINGTGESSVTKNYSHTDKGLAPGTYYYRLKQIDLDGKNTFSAIVSATVSGKGNVSLFQNYPNPFSTSTSIRFDLPKAQHARLSVLDLSGREVKVLTDKVSEAGSHIVTLDAASLSRQTYLVRLQTENGIITKKISVQ